MSTLFEIRPMSPELYRRQTRRQWSRCASIT